MFKTSSYIFEKLSLEISNALSGAEKNAFKHFNVISINDNDVNFVNELPCREKVSCAAKKKKKKKKKEISLNW